ncbi:hypothetical protein SDC9_146497 [bioreactor metagenome]|uniref:Uncharacterized protein n=1 Tax=bioreactor metagenome TaxID=1076179 RepID=A0A645EC89_9ZZZZ
MLSPEKYLLGLSKYKLFDSGVPAGHLGQNTLIIDKPDGINGFNLHRVFLGIRIGIELLRLRIRR